MDEEAEIAVSLSDCRAAMLELKEIVRSSGIAVNFITEVGVCSRHVSPPLTYSAHTDTYRHTQSMMLQGCICGV